MDCSYAAITQCGYHIQTGVLGMKVVSGEQQDLAFNLYLVPTDMDAAACIHVQQLEKF